MPVEQLTEEEKKKREQEARAALLAGGELSPEELASYSSEFGNIPSRRQEAKSAYEKQSERSDWAELADKIAQSLVKMGAAYRGSKSGVDLSGIRIDGTDWDKVRQRHLGEYQTELGAIGQREKELADLVAAGAKGQKKEKPQVTTYPASDSIEKSSGLVPTVVQTLLPEGGISQKYYIRGKEVPAESIIPNPAKEKREPLLDTKDMEARNLITNEGDPVYRHVTTDRRTGKSTVELTDENGNPLSKGQYKTKVGIDPKALLSDNQVSEIASQDNVLAALENIKEVKQGIDTGGVENLRNWAAQWLGVDDPNVTTFKAQVNQQLADYIRSISGLTVAQGERQFLMANTPNMGDKDETFNAKMDRLIPKLQQIRTRYLEALQKNGKDVSEYLKSAPPAPMTGSVESGQQQSPQGQVGSPQKPKSWQQYQQERQEKGK